LKGKFKYAINICRSSKSRDLAFHVRKEIDLFLSTEYAHEKIFGTHFNYLKFVYILELFFDLEM
jgi:hypothetical protein